MEGRTGEMFGFSDGTGVHPIVFSSVIGKERGVAEYQVRQRGDAVDIDIVPSGALDIEALVGAVRKALCDAGVARVDVRVGIVDAIERHGTTAKLRRFVPGA